MLVLSRKVDESIVIGEGEGAITITVVDVQAGKCRLGIDAPESVRVLRSELLPPANGATGGSEPKPKPKAPRKRRRRL